jgi:hypothetical protein
MSLSEDAFVSSSKYKINAIKQAINRKFRNMVPNKTFIYFARICGLPVNCQKSAVLLLLFFLGSSLSLFSTY